MDFLITNPTFRKRFKDAETKALRNYLQSKKNKSGGMSLDEMFSKVRKAANPYNSLARVIKGRGGMKAVSKTRRTTSHQKLSSEDLRLVSQLAGSGLLGGSAKEFFKNPIKYIKKKIQERKMRRKKKKLENLPLETKLLLAELTEAPPVPVTPMDAVSEIIGEELVQPALDMSIQPTPDVPIQPLDEEDAELARIKALAEYQKSRG